MLSVSYAGKNACSAGKTSGVLRGGASGANRCYVLAHCGGGANWDLEHKEVALKSQIWNISKWSKVIMFDSLSDYVIHEQLLHSLL